MAKLISRGMFVFHFLILAWLVLLDWPGMALLIEAGLTLWTVHELLGLTEEKVLEFDAASEIVGIDFKKEMAMGVKTYYPLYLFSLTGLVCVKVVMGIDLPELVALVMILLLAFMQAFVDFKVSTAYLNSLKNIGR